MTMAAIGPRRPKFDSRKSEHFQSCSEEVQNVAGSGRSVNILFWM